MKLGPFDINKVHQGHVIDLLRELPDESIQCVVTSPPYWGLRDYGLPPSVLGGDVDCEHEWSDAEYRLERHGDTGLNSPLEGGKDSQAQTRIGTITTAFCRKCGAWKGCLGLEPTPDLYVEHLVEVFCEIKRVLRKDGIVWLNLGDCYTPQSSQAGGTHYDGLNKKKNWEPRSRALITKKPFGKPKDLMGMPWHVAFALQADGWWIRSDIIWAKSNPMPESVKDRPTSSHEHIFMLTKSAKYFYDHIAVREKHATPKSERHNKAGKQAMRGQESIRPRGSLEKCDSPEQRYFHPSGRNRRSVWNVSTKPFKGGHFATFPPEIPEICIKAATSEKGCCPRCGAPIQRVVKKDRQKHDGKTKSQYEKGSASNRLALLRQAAHEAGGEYENKNETIGWEPTCKCGLPPPGVSSLSSKLQRDDSQVTGSKSQVKEADLKTLPCVVLDPFAGSGTTGEVAVKLGRNFIGFDLNEKYVKEFANPRIEAAIQGLKK